MGGEEEGGGSALGTVLWSWWGRDFPKNDPWGVIFGVGRVGKGLCVCPHTQVMVLRPGGLIARMAPSL